MGARRFWAPLDQPGGSPNVTAGGVAVDTEVDVEPSLVTTNVNNVGAGVTAGMA